MELLRLVVISNSKHLRECDPYIIAGPGGISNMPRSNMCLLTSRIKLIIIHGKSFDFNLAETYVNALII